MDPLSVAASIAGLIGLANEMTRILAAYGANIKSDHEDSRSLLQELAALRFALEKMCILIRGERMRTVSLSRISALISVLSFTSLHIQGLYKKLNKFKIAIRIPEFIERRKWPLLQDECEKEINFALFGAIF